MIKCTFDRSFPFNYEHGFLALKQHADEFGDAELYEDQGETIDGTKVWLFIDMPETIKARKAEVKEAKKQGIKIVSLFYDPARFPLVDQLIAEGLIDELILFDKNHRGRFPIPTFISDYYVNASLFPQFKEERNGKMCYFGHLQVDRELPAKCKHIKMDDFKALYEAASYHSKGWCPSSGKDEQGGILHHNKAKFIEMLFCGLEGECQKGIDTLNYNFYRGRKIDMGDVYQMSFINARVINELIKQITK